MKVYSAIVLVLGYLSVGHGYSKYGRSCKDIGCLSNEVCVMETDPCSYYQRQNECGSYPTCKKTSANQHTCATYVCPPSTMCQMVGSNPKCVNDPVKKGHIGYDTSSLDSQVQPAGDQNQPSAPPAGGGNLYPSVPKGETTPRPNIRPAVGGGSGYQGGQIGSGYPGQPSRGGYQQPNSGYPQQTGGYPQQSGGYPGYQGGYQQPGGYPQGNYQGYPGYQQPAGGYPQYNQNNQNRYGQKSTGSSISDQLSSTLKSLGLFCIVLKYLISKMYAV